jgi:hypothetical protein
LDEINEKLAEIELNCIKEKDSIGEHLLQTVRMIKVLILLLEVLLLALRRLDLEYY